MAIRLNKVLTELNIGLQTAVDYLKNKKNLGEIREDANLSTKITDEQYNALVREFKGDKDIKSEAEKIFAKKTKDKKSDRKVTKAEDLLEQRPAFKPLGKIDLDNIGRKPAHPAKETKEEKPKQAAPATADVKPAEAAPAAEKKETVATA
ncbi:MAG: translation initiation factor IF-2, partial [Prevotella sp.]|nr:translation initiation factor IF-2 [Prevotella sp.]